MHNKRIELPNSPFPIIPECEVKLGRFDNQVWIVRYGWYAWGGNREVCGWYLVNKQDRKILKPLNRADLDDIYLIEHR